jgi:hypothetical protein
MIPAKQAREIFESANDQRELERVALALAVSSSEQDLALLEEYLKTERFLRRLDTTTDPYVKTQRFGNVVARLGENVSGRAGKVLLTLIRSPDVNSDAVRVEVVRRAAAHAKPMTEDRIEVLRSVHPGIYFLSNLGLLLSNTSPPALEEAKRMILAKPPDITDGAAVGIMHLHIVGRRTDVNLIKMAIELARSIISSALRRGLFESFFDYNYEMWYEPMGNPPKPPAWNTASPAALRAIIELAKLAEGDLPPTLKEKAAATAAEAGRLLRSPF